MIIDPAFSNTFNYHINQRIFDYVDRITENKSCPRLEAYSSCFISNITTLIMRVMSVAEIIIHGSGLLIISPFLDNKAEKVQEGITYLKQVPCEIASTPLLCIEFLGDCVAAIIDPKYFILYKSECTKAIPRHIGEGNECTTTNPNCALYCSDPSVRAKRRLLEFQGMIKYSE